MFSEETILEEKGDAHILALPQSFVFELILSDASMPHSPTDVYPISLSPQGESHSLSNPTKVFKPLDDQDLISCIPSPYKDPLVLLLNKHTPYRYELMSKSRKVVEVLEISP